MTLKVTTFSSKGRVTRVFGHKTKRIHHLQSDNQLRVFFALEWLDKVTNIEENVELKDLMITLNSIEDLRLDKFMNQKTGELYKLHTNFLVTIKSDNVFNQIAISVKSISELERKIVIEKMEIERRYWECKKVPFYLITEREIDKKFVKNIEWVRETLNIDSINEKALFSEQLYYFLRENSEELVEEALKKFDFEMNLLEGTALFLFRYLIAKREIEIDMYKTIDLNKKVIESIKF